MSSNDAPDWERIVTTVQTAGDVPDAPDWERIVVGPGGKPVGGGNATLSVLPNNLVAFGGIFITNQVVPRAGDFVVRVEMCASTYNSGVPSSGEFAVWLVLGHYIGSGTIAAQVSVPWALNFSGASGFIPQVGYVAVQAEVTGAAASDVFNIYTALDPSSTITPTTGPQGLGGTFDWAMMTSWPMA